jgi:hypothetical protein
MWVIYTSLSFVNADIDLIDFALGIMPPRTSFLYIMHPTQELWAIQYVAIPGTKDAQPGYQKRMIAVRDDTLPTLFDIIGEKVTYTTEEMKTDGWDV